MRNAMAEVLQDERLRNWFDEFFAHSRKALEDVNYAHSDEAKAKRRDMRARWKSLSSAEDNTKWHQLVEKVKTDWASFENALKEDADLNAVKESQWKLGEDLKMGLTEQVGEGVEQAFEQVTWFWQDLFKVYLPSMLGQLKAVPIPRYGQFLLLDYVGTDSDVVGRNTRTTTLNSSLRILMYPV